MLASNRLRKRDVELNFVGDDGQPVGDIAVDIQQVGHQFAFGSTMRDTFLIDPVFAEFFRQNFEYATVEWFTQWKPIEGTRGVEDYTTADASVAFTRENGIKLRGHALAWGDTRFMPPWLPDLDEAATREEVYQRIDNVVTRYSGQLIHWDVSNEMLNYNFFEENVGPDIRPEMFKRARENDANVKLFTNEYGLTNSQEKTARYRELVTGLQASGADVGGIGMQSHFETYVSPKGMEIALAQLTDLGPEIWFTEFDVGNLNVEDPVVENINHEERAKQLETFYRYAFSVPEAEGIIMWGFWADGHWRGADAAIVNSDWTLNAAGEKYFDLMDEWTTHLTTSVSGSSQTNFRGFHGNYVITTTRNGIEQFHVVSVEKAEAGEGAVSIELNVSSEPESNGLVMLYGTSADDEFKYDFANPTAVEINGVISHVPALDASPRFSVSGGLGSDRLEILGSQEQERFLMGPSSLHLIGGTNRIVFRQIEDVECFAGNREDQIIMSTTQGLNEFVSEPTKTQWFLGNRQISATDFEALICRSKSDQDVATVLDGELQRDGVSTDFKTYVRARATDSFRQFQNFSTNRCISKGGDDIFVGELTDQPAQIAAAINESQFTVSGRSYEFSGFALSRVQAEGDAVGSAAVIEVEDDAAADTVVFQDENLLIRRGSLRFSLTGVRDLETISGTNDRVIIYDSSGNDTVDANSDRILTQIDDYDIISKGTGATIVVSSEGNDIATEQGRPVRLRLIGDWINQ